MRLGGRLAPLVLSLSLLLVAGCTGGKEGGDDSGGDGGTADLVDYLVPDPDGVEGGFPRCLADADAAFQEEYGLEPTMVWVRYRFDWFVSLPGLSLDHCVVSAVHTDFPDAIFEIYLYDRSYDGEPEIRSRDFAGYGSHADSVEGYGTWTATGLRVDMPDIASIVANDAFPGIAVDLLIYMVASAALFREEHSSFDGVSDLDLALLDDHHPLVWVQCFVYRDGGGSTEYVVLDGRTGIVLTVFKP